MATDAKKRPRTAPLYECLATPAPRGALNLYWLGQAGFAIRSASQLALVDPYLSNSLAEKYRDALFKHKRMMPAPIAPDETRGVDLLLASHAHSDHLDPGSVGKIMAMNPECVLVCPCSAVPKALERGADPDRISCMRTLDWKRFGPATIELLPSAHEELAVDEDRDTLYAGFVIEMEGVRLYHSGDCVPFAGQAQLLRERRVDLALLPVNGRDDERRKNGVPGNFTIDEAARLCLDAGIPVLVPHHFGMFDFNTADPGDIAAGLEKYATQGLEYILPDTESCIAVSACG